MFYNTLDVIMLPIVHVHNAGFIYLSTSAFRFRPFGLILAVLQSENVLEMFKIDIRNSGYYAIIYYYFDEARGKIRINELSLICLILVGSVFMMSMLVIFISGYKLYKIVHDVNLLKSTSSRNIHRELFWTLIVQSATPFLLFYLPTYILLFAPVFQVKIGLLEYIQPMFLSIYPILDSLTVILFYRGFRKALKDIFSKSRVSQN
ncbi:unnamed protein product [Caenorhabditis angaria]|uniref:7TM GPCR serpentine receptor class x (Srx) domain-containing protein n=1 Tax=Caenorhabditis angaria TaxID=860376 RepID=A0A9P1N642_9PELO|nr:unnamed protein product [Caenorhabditis angaria]